MDYKTSGGSRPAQIVEPSAQDLQDVSGQRHRRPAPAVTRSYRAAVMYIASLKCWCDGQPELCTPCVARMTVSRVTGTPDPSIVKCCGRCKTFKRGDQFYPDARYADGLASWCSSCTRADSRRREAA